MSLVFLAVGIGIGFLIGWLYLKSQRTDKGQESDELKLQLKLEIERSSKLGQDIREINDQLRAEREEVIHLNNQNASLKANYSNLKERLEEQRLEVGKLQEKFSIEFKNLANEIFEEKSKKFTDQNKTNLNELLNPLGQKLSDFERKIEQTNKESLERSTALREQIIGLRELNDRMTKEAENLTKALKGDVKTQGNWGEMILERILEKSGLEKGREYFIQETLHSEEGKRLRPDVIIKLPDNKNLVVDAKASLVAYEKYVNEEDPLLKEQYLKGHILSVKNHIKGLTQKSYHQLFDGGALDYVLMFIPIEAAFASVVQHGGELYNEAHDKSIIIVSPTTLIATLRTVASIWKHEYQNRNALEIARQGGALYDKFKAFVDDLILVGKSLDRSKDQYKDAMNKLVDGKDNLVRKTERLKELGAKTGKALDQELLNRAGAKGSDEMMGLLGN